jgi:hypothetical protein
LPHAGRPGANAGEIEHGEAGESLRSAGKRHSKTPAELKSRQSGTIAESGRLVMRPMSMPMSSFGA